jgi:hypothetical protein
MCLSGFQPWCSSFPFWILYVIYLGYWKPQPGSYPSTTFSTSLISLQSIVNSFSLLDLSKFTSVHVWEIWMIKRTSYPQKSIYKSYFMQYQFSADGPKWAYSPCCFRSLQQMQTTCINFWTYQTLQIDRFCVSESYPWFGFPECGHTSSSLLCFEVAVTYASRDAVQCHHGENPARLGSFLCARWSLISLPNSTLHSCDPTLQRVASIQHDGARYRVLPRWYVE